MDSAGSVRNSLFRMLLISLFVCMLPQGLFPDTADAPDVTDAPNAPDVQQARKGTLLHPQSAALLFEDRDGRFTTLESLLSAEAAGHIRFSPIPNRNLGISSSIWWLKLPMESSPKAGGEQVLQLICPSIDRVNAWLLSCPVGQGKPAAQSASYALGRTQQAGAKPPLFAHPYLSFYLPPGEELCFYIRLESTDNIYLDLHLSSWEDAAARSARSGAMLILVYGIILAMILFNALLLTGKGDGTNITYLFYLVSLLLYLLSADGTMFILFSHRIPWFAQRSNYIFSITTIVALLLFTRLFLQVPRLYPGADRPLTGFVFLGILLLPPLLLFPGMPLVLYMAGLVELLFLLFLFYLSLRTLLDGNRQARFYFLSWGGMIVLVTLTQLRNLGLLPPSFLTTGSLNLGAALQVLLLSAGVADRMRIMERENLLLRREKERMEEEQRQKNDFLIHVSHELRTPLTIIRGIIGELRSGPGESFSGGKQQTLDTMERNVARISALSGRIGNLMQMDSRLVRPHLEEGALLPLVEELANEFQPAARRAGLSFRFANLLEGAVTVGMDRELLKEALSNLLDNAIHYTPRGRVELLLSRLGQSPPGPGDDKAPSVVNISVVDSGIGVPPEDRERIFTRFFRHPAAVALRSEGFGVGLSLVQEIARLHGGSVSVEERKGRGSIFSLQLPLFSPPSRAVESESPRIPPPPEGTAALTGGIAAAEGGHSCLILLVEDDRELSDYLIRGLSDSFQVVSAPDPESALKLLGEGCRPRIILSDIMMGLPQGMDGIDLFHRARNLPGMETVPFVFITARDQEKERIGLLNQGAADYLLKPFSLDYLKAKIFSILRLHALSPGDVEEQLAVTAADYSLTERQQQVLRLLLAGKNKKEIARELKPGKGRGSSVSVKTVDNHIQSIYRILDVHSHSELLARFLPGSPPLDPFQHS